MLYGESYMMSVCRTFMEHYNCNINAFSRALDENGTPWMYLDGGYDYYDLTDFIEKHGLDINEVKRHLLEDYDYEYGNKHKRVKK